MSNLQDTMYVISYFMSNIFDTEPREADRGRDQLVFRFCSWRNYPARFAAFCSLIPTLISIPSEAARTLG